MRFFIFIFIFIFSNTAVANFVPVIREHRFLRLPSPETLPVRKVVLSSASCAFSWVESTNHLYRVHEVVTVGVNKGTRAVSSYGLMPITVRELLKTGFKDTDTGFLVSKAKTHKEINEITKIRFHDDVAFKWHWKKTKRSISRLVEIKEHRFLVSVLAHYAGVTGSYKYYVANGFDGVKSHWYTKKFLYSLNNRC